jgi:hypothetical protein
LRAWIDGGIFSDELLTFRMLKGRNGDMKSKELPDSELELVSGVLE